MASKAATQGSEMPPSAGVIDEKEISAGKKAEKIKVKNQSFTGLRIIVTLFLIVLAAVFIYLSLFQNIFELRTKLIHAISMLDPNYRTLNERIIEYNASQRQLEADKLKLDSDKQALAAEWKELEDAHTSLDAREAAVTENETFQMPIYLRGLGDEKVKELKNLGSIYSKMDAETAADIMARLYDVTHIAMIIYHMDTTAAAEVLAALSPDTAAKVTSELLRT